MNQRIWIAQLIVMGLMVTAVTTACTRADTNTQQIAAPPTTIITETATAILPTPTTAAPIEAAATPTASVQTQDSTPPHATLNTIHNLEEYPADAPIIVHFNEPMNSANNRPLLFSPTISGSFEWNDENTTVQFTPNNPFLGNRVYQISVNASLRTQDNRLTNIDRWRIHIRSTPLVQRRTPHEPTVATHKPIFRLYFNQPMNAQSVADAFNMEPPLPYTLSWDEDTLLVSIQEPLTFGTAYHFSVANTAVDTTGYHLLNGYTWDTQLKPLVNGFSKPTINTHLAPVEVSFNYPIDPEKSSSFVSIQPPIEGNWSWNDEYTQLTFAPDHRFDTEREYELLFSGTVFTQGGYEVPVPDSALEFVSPPTVLNTLPGANNAHPSKPIQIMFDRLMDQAATETAVSIIPPIDGSFTWNETTLIFKPARGYFDEFTTYEVTVSTNALGADGEVVLRHPYVWEFNTTKATSAANFGEGPRYQVVDVNGRRAIQYHAALTQSILVGFELHQIPNDQFATVYAANYTENYWEPTQVTGVEDPPFSTSWSMETNPADEEWMNIQETIIPADVPAGVYLLNITTGNVNDQLIVILTDNSIIAKISDEQLIAWVTDINDHAQPNVPVSILTQDGTIIASGSTNEDGVFRANVPTAVNNATQDEAAYLVIAEQNGTLAVTGLQRAWRTGGLYSWGRTNKSSVDYAAYIYTDRPIYKPGQTVYFKGIVRQDDDAVLSMIPTGTAVTIRIRDARNNLVQTIPLISNSFGTVDGEFEIATGAMLGTYQVELIVDNQIHTQPFRVEDYRKPDYEVTVSTDHEFYVKGDLINITIDTEYFFGEPVPNAEVEIRQFQLIENFQWSGMPGEYIWLNDYGSPITGTTDENGRFTTAIRANYHGNYNNYWYGRNLNHTIWGIEATVSDDSNQTVSSFNPIRVYNASQQISVEHANFHEPGQPFPLHATVTNLDGQPVANKTVTIHLLRYRNGNYDDEVQSSSFTTDANGNAHTNFVANEPGYYRLELRGTDGNNHPIQYKSWLYAFSSNRSSGWNGRSTGLHIDADKTSYAPGETAVLYIESQIEGPALLTIERGTIRREELVMLTPPLTQVELPIETTDAPNIFATITTWKPQNLTIDDDIYFSLNDSTIHSASIELSVPASDKQLQVTITPDQESYAPGDEATFTVKVTNNAGVPVSAEVSLALVDDAIFALSDELSGPIYEGFYFDRDNLIRTFHSMAPQRYLGGGMGGGGGGGDAAGNPRRDFQDTAVWIPTLHTDFNGEVQVTVTLPDNLTRWRMTAKATTADTQVGETITTVTATQPVLIRPLLPRTLTAGDNFQLTGLLHNNTNQPQKLAVTLQETGDTQKLTIADPITLTLMLEPGEVRAVGWTVIVTEAGSAEIIMIAQYNDDSTTLSPTGVADSVLLPLSIRPLAIPNVETEVGQFTNQYETSITIPNDALEMSEVQIQLSRSIAGSMLDGLDYLTGYPYGCVEQTMSKALPNAVVGRAMNQLGISIPELEADLPRQINASIQRLYGFQHDDGGWGWWFDDKTHDYQTAWVLYGLVTTKEAGYEVDAQVIERGANWLIENLNQMDEKTRAFALYSLAIAGYGDETETVTLAENADELDTFAQASLALALFAMDRSDAARELLDLLAETAVIFENGYVYWEGNANDGNYSRKTMASDTRNTAIALSAFARIQPNHPLEPGIVRWLMAMRQQSGWGTTNETAFAIVGLTDHLISTRFSDTTANTTYSVLINGETFTTGSLNGNNPATTVSIPRAALEGQNEVVITQDGERPLYFVVNTRTYLAEPTIQKAGVVNVIRTYRDPGTNAPIESIAAGELVRVQLMINMPEAGSYILIEDNLPGGLEALNEGLNITSHAVEQYADVKYSWQRYGYNQKEVHGDHVSFFVTELPKGSHTFTYYARATQTGTFTAMPTEVSAMYDFAFWGRSGSTQLIIHE